ncbi:hypothetical protein [Vibrio genomosp. F10]|uniref:hypothetical protein n=1 Tax=Vibrio genomosp. F10 TaxID=723171 RepID=UPI00037C9814|nr:hypothetical protein [Vibrio genomosp. F10]OEE82082.1 hypothetical protein A1QK_04465 [Vibrio genomosp. F10 str. 9ZD137]
MKKQTLTILPGLPAIGKEAYASNRDAVLIEAEQFNPRLIRYAHAWCQLKTKRNLALGRNVVLISRFIKLGEIEFYQKLTDRMVIELEVDVGVIELSAQAQNLHGVPPATIQRIAGQFRHYRSATQNQEA